ncbi:MAG: hypothetical protein JSS11_02355 [Verrucomicrobia bacterium]|nr:hypothetical protein [Verrucomicrobiota bacterium]
MANDMESLALIMQQIRTELGPPEQDTLTARQPARSGVAPAYDWGQVLTFGAAGNGLPCLGRGWSYPEETRTWSEEASAGLALQVSPVHGLVILSFRCEPFTSDKTPTQVVRLAAGGQIQGEWMITQPGDYHALLSLPVGTETITMEFQFRNAHSPLDAGLSADPRKLGIALNRLSLHPLPSSTS